MIKHKLLYTILVFTLFVAGIIWFFAYPRFQKNEDSNNTTTSAISTVSLNGNYILDTASPFQNSDVKISNSSEKEISYSITTVHFGHLGNLEGDAQRTDSSLFVYTDIIKDESEICSVVISFESFNNLSYDASGEACDDFHGAHGTFFNNEVHKKNGSVSLPTIKELGFTEKDLAKFNSLLPAENNSGTLLEYAQKFINVETSIVKKITSRDIPNAVGHSIETPNIYNGMSTCFSDWGGFCIFVAFIKSDTNYWILEGSNAGDNFRYATDNSQWKKKLPSVFKSELDRIGISSDIVKLLP